MRSTTPIRLYDSLADRRVESLVGVWHSDYARPNRQRQKQPFEMTDSPGRLIASGRAADVFDQGDGTVLRRYKTEYDCELEGRVMSWLREQGVPVPAIHRVAGPDIVMDLVTGPTLMEELDRHPTRVIGHGRLLASLQSQLNSVTAPSWFPTYSSVPEGDRVLHLDLHPMNIIVGPDGPVIIDWTNAARGQAGFDAALTFVLMSTFEMGGLKDRIGRWILVESFRRARGRALIRSFSRDACVHRLADINVTDGERATLEAMIYKADS